MTDTVPVRSEGVPSSRSGMLDLSAKYRAGDGEFFFTGVQALVRVPFDQLRADARAGLRTAAFVSGYQGSPLGGFDRELASMKAMADSQHVVHVPGINEELAATSVMGSQLSSTFRDATYDGVVGIWYGKAPGLDRAGDAIRHANFAGTARHGGVLALAGDDPACKSSTLPSGSDHTLADLHLPTITPGTVQEVLDFGLHGIALSRIAGLWTGFRIVTAVADGTATAVIDADRIVPVLPTIEFGGKPYVPAMTAKFVGPSNAIEREIYEARLPLASLYAAANAAINVVTVDPADAWIGIVAAGRTYYEVVEALRELGLDERSLRDLGVRLLRIGMTYPLEPDIVRRFARGLAEIVVVEEKRPFLESALRDVLYGTADAPRIVGKHTPDGGPLVQYHGALDADLVVEPLRSRLLQRIPADRLTPPAPAPRPRTPLAMLPARAPFFCSGCPHNTGTKVPEGSVVGAGIGCHGMVTFMPGDRAGDIIGFTQMGGEGTQWIGIAPFVETDHLIQNIGDGTYFHSGSLAVRSAIAAGAHMTFKILYNGTVAMTGGQDAAGAIPVPELAATLVLQGVQRVIVTTDEKEKYRGVRLHEGVEVWPRERIIEAQQELAKLPGVTALIHDQQCAAELRRDRKRGKAVDPAMRVVINERVCEGCGDCGVASNCLSVQPVETEFGRKTRIDQSSCNKDYSCLAGDCPSFVTVVPKKRAAKRSAADPSAARRNGGGRRRPPLDRSLLPEPISIVPTDDVTIRMPGIGGTGVVTVNQILGTAAMLDGRYVNGLDQTGLSQKAGPVVSDLRISRHPIEGANKVMAGQVDVYLVFDLLVGLGAANIAGASPERTVAVVSTTRTPTGAMVIDPKIGYPDTAALLADLGAATRSDDIVHLDASAVAEGLFGDTTTANMLVVGAAYQRGALPIAAAAIEQAIELNGAAVEVNRLAFSWGRMWVVDQAAVEGAMAGTADEGSVDPARLDAMLGDLSQADGEFGRVLRLRTADLIAYQDERYARRYLDSVRAVAAAEQRAVPGSTQLAQAATRNLYKLMAYKDEYEVARLHRLSAARAHLEAEVGGDVKVTYHLHPPVLRSMGMQRKLKLGGWIAPAFATLAASRKLRGTALDPFGRAKVRRVERELVTEYEGILAALAGGLDSDRLAEAIELANLPDLVRGYEDIKLANVDRYRSELARLRSSLGV